MFLSLADLPVRDALPDLRVWVITARLACMRKRPVFADYPERSGVAFSRFMHPDHKF